MPHCLWQHPLRASSLLNLRLLFSALSLSLRLSASPVECGYETFPNSRAHRGVGLAGLAAAPPSCSASLASCACWTLSRLQRLLPRMSPSSVATWPTSQPQRRLLPGRRRCFTSPVRLAPASRGRWCWIATSVRPTTSMKARGKGGSGGSSMPSSIHAVGFVPLEEGADARTPHRPDTLYGLAKCFAEDLARLYWDKWGVESVCLRISSCFDEPETRRHLWSFLTYDDLARLVVRSLIAPRVGFTVAYGISDNDEKPVSNRYAGASRFPGARQCGVVAREDSCRGHPEEDPATRRSRT